ncbi:MAG: HAD-IA family hydrolase [Nanoarchaeota archaeon]
MKLIMFDYDGVIMDTFAFTKQIYKELGKEFKINIPDDEKEFRELLELDWRETLKKLNIVTKTQLEKNEEIFKKGLKKYSKLIKPYNGIPETLKMLSKKYILTVVTNNYKSEVDYRLSRYKLSSYFRGYFAEDDGDLKPKPDILLKCLKKFNISPKDAFYVGDMDGDIIAGKAAKVKTIAVTYGFHTKKKLKDADIMVDSPRELITLLN